MAGSGTAEEQNDEIVCVSVWWHHDGAKDKGFRVEGGGGRDETGHDEWQDQALRKK